MSFIQLRPQNSNGQSNAEYIIGAILIAVVCLLSVRLFGDSVTCAFRKATIQVGSGTGITEEMLAECGIDPATLAEEDPEPGSGSSDDSSAESGNSSSSTSDDEEGGGGSSSSQLGSSSESTGESSSAQSSSIAGGGGGGSSGGGGGGGSSDPFGSSPSGSSDGSVGGQSPPSSSAGSESSAGAEPPAGPPSGAPPPPEPPAPPPIPPAPPPPPAPPICASVNNPTVAGAPLDRCINRAQNCGQIAADYYCLYIGCSAATRFTAGNAVVKTYILGDGNYCDAIECFPNCGCTPFVFIECR